jgi:hypothetical protein
LCPVSGAGKLTKPERERKAKAVIAESGADTIQHFEKVEAVNRGETVRAQAAVWLDQLQRRKRRPVKRSTIHGWRSLLQTWVLPELGDLNVAEVNNAVLKRFVEKLCAANLSPHSIKNICLIPKLVVGSVLDSDGNEIHPRKWRNDYIDMPPVTSTHCPVFNSGTVSQIVAQSEGQYRVLFALLAGTGMRAGEALGLEVKHVSEDGSTISIEQSVWAGQTQLPKTANAIREIDCPSELAAMLKAFIGDRKTGFLFQTRTGKSLTQVNVLKRQLHPLLKKLNVEIAGFHAARRFRTSFLRKSRCPEDLIRFWLGHANRSVTDGYSRLKDDVEFRKQCVESIGLGFEMPSENGEVAPKSLICTQTVSECVTV